MNEKPDDSLVPWQPCRLQCFLCSFTLFFHFCSTVGRWPAVFSTPVQLPGWEFTSASSSVFYVLIDLRTLSQLIKLRTATVPPSSTLNFSDCVPNHRAQERNIISVSYAIQHQGPSCAVWNSSLSNALCRHISNRSNKSKPNREISDFLCLEPSYLHRIFLVLDSLFESFSLSFVWGCSLLDLCR